jgi:cyclopropane fatty-acyl-phospholipid synthase-like methyltransferase
MENPMGAHPLWLTEWLTEHMALEPDMRVLDLGCGKAKSSIFLAREFGVEVWAVDLWTGADENLMRVEDAGVSDRVVPIHADARQLPFAGEYFDVVVCIDSFNFFGTDDLYLNYLAHFLKDGGILAFASAGLTRDFDGAVPDHLRQLWAGGDYWTLHTVDWWRRHVAKTGLFEVTFADTIPDGWRLWSEWSAATDSAAWYRETVEVDQGRYLAYVSLVAQRIPGRPLAKHAWPATLSSWKSECVPHPLLRSEEKERGRLSSIVSRFRPGR